MRLITMTLFLKYHNFHVFKQLNCKSLAFLTKILHFLSKTLHFLSKTLHFLGKMLRLPKVWKWSWDGDRSVWDIRANA